MAKIRTTKMGILFMIQMLVLILISPSVLNWGMRIQLKTRMIEKNGGEKR